MRIMVVGGGGREHALVWKISQSTEVEKIIVVPGNAGMQDLALCLEGNPEEPYQMVEIAREYQVDLTLVGPEGPLVQGIVDVFYNEGFRILGPTQEGALLESSKSWAKEFMREWEIPTAPFQVFDDYYQAEEEILRRDELPVIKANGLAAGKGVLIPRNRDEAREGLYSIMVERCFGEAGEKVVLENKLSGEEASLLALTDGDNLQIMPSAQDHKPVGEGDTGPNTGGMGAYSPAPVMSPEKIHLAKEKVFEPLLQGLKDKGITYRGIIYAGLMVEGKSIKVLEFNVRLGDPEAQALIPRMDSDIVPWLNSAAGGKIEGEIKWKDDFAVCVVMASQGYPGAYEKGKVITGLEKLRELSQVEAFHAGTKYDHGKLVTNGGRVLGITAWDQTLAKAKDRVYNGCRKVDFEGCHYRRDIGYKALQNK